MSSTPVFSFETLNNLFNACSVITVKKQTERQLSDDLKKYIHTYFFQTTSNNYLFYDASKDIFDTYKKEDFMDLYFSRFPIEIKHYFFHQSYRIFKTVIHPTQPRIHNNEINLFQGMLHTTVNNYETYNDEIKSKVELFLSYIKEVLASGNENEYQYLIKWTAKMAQGQKNDSVLYLKGIEGIGKSTFSDFLYYYVIGKKASTLSDAEPLLTPNNKELCGKLLVVFEELPTFSDRHWEGVSSKLKKAITSDTEKYADKYEKRFECENLNNYIINTNVEALKHSEGRRFFLMSLSTHRKGDHSYFGNIKTQCYNKQVGEAFYSYLHSIDITDFNSQRDMPDTSNKLDAIADRLDYVYRFVKDMFIFQKKEINHTVKDLYDEYLYYMKLSDKKPCLKTQFCKKMRDVNLNYYASRGINKYHITLEKLKACAKTNKWIHELDDYIEEEDEFEENVKTNYKDLETENEQLKKEIKELKKKLNAYILTEGHLALPTINLTVNNNNNNNNNNHDAKRLANSEGVNDDGERVIIPYNYFAKKAQQQQKTKKSSNHHERVDDDKKMMDNIADALLSNNDVVFFSVM